MCAFPIKHLPNNITICGQKGSHQANKRLAIIRKWNKVVEEFVLQGTAICGWYKRTSGSFVVLQALVTDLTTRTLFGTCS